jgi:hypothetical protein
VHQLVDFHARSLAFFQSFLAQFYLLVDAIEIALFQLFYIADAGDVRVTNHRVELLETVLDLVAEQFELLLAPLGNHLAEVADLFLMVSNALFHIF